MLHTETFSSLIILLSIRTGTLSAFVSENVLSFTPNHKFQAVHVVRRTITEQR